MFSRNRVNPDRPSWFDYEKIFRNLLVTMDSNCCNLTVCFEKEEDYNNHFIKNYIGVKDFKVEFIKTPVQRKIFLNESWSHSLAAASEIIDRDIRENKIEINDLIYILEDDYLHHPFWVPMVLDFFNNTASQLIYDNDIVCLYDHFDKYLFVNPVRSDHWGMYADLKSQIIVSNYRHWRQVPNCGLSMIMSRNIWVRDKDMWLEGYSDCEIGHQVTSKYKTRIWTPMPALNTHCVNPFVAPLIDWEKVINLK